MISKVVGRFCYINLNFIINIHIPHQYDILKSEIVYMIKWILKEFEEEKCRHLATESTVK